MDGLVVDVVGYKRPEVFALGTAMRRGHRYLFYLAGPDSWSITSRVDASNSETVSRTVVVMGWPPCWLFAAKPLALRLAREDGDAAGVELLLASDSCPLPEKTSTSLDMTTSTKPVSPRICLHSASSRAPAIQPLQRSMSSFAVLRHLPVDEDVASWMRRRA